MPNQAEQIDYIEAALRQRFFVRVLKIETPSRAQWNESQHDTDRLSRALAAYTLVSLASIDDVVASRALTDGTNDGGIDALYYDRTGSRLLIVQSKFKRSGTAPSQDENLKTINGVRDLLNRRFNKFNTYFQQRISEIEEAFDTPGVMIEIILVFLGSNLGPHVSNDLNDFQFELNVVNSGMSWNWYGCTQVYQWLIAEQTPSTVTTNIILENWASVTTPRKAIYGQVRAAELAQLVNRYGKALFERNIRHYLGAVDVNTAIENTVRQRPSDLFYLNNGITVIASNVTQAQGRPNRCTFRLVDMSIVNGAQTAGAIATAATAGEISPDAKVLITIIEINSAPDDIGERITRARNYQNTVKKADFAALDANQERLRRELASIGVSYFYRPSEEARIRRADACTFEEAALAISCFAFPVLTSAQVNLQSSKGIKVENSIELIIIAKKQISKLWDQDSVTYSMLFNEHLSGIHMGRLIYIYRFVDQILADSEQSETSYERRTFFKHGRYFIMTILAQQSKEVLNRTELLLSETDKTLLSQLTNELAELIYAESINFKSDKGYLFMFKNLTECQLLADRVLARLAERAQ